MRAALDGKKTKRGGSHADPLHASTANETLRIPLYIGACMNRAVKFRHGSAFGGSRIMVQEGGSSRGVHTGDNALNMATSRSPLPPTDLIPELTTVDPNSVFLHASCG